MFNQLKKPDSISLINGVIVVMVVVLISMVVAGFYQRASAGNEHVAVQSFCNGCNKTDNGFSAGNNNIYGKTISNNSVLTIKELEKNKNKYLGNSVKIEGTITEVCQAMGCWFYVDDGTGNLYVDLGMNGSFTIPKNSAKSHVIVEGIFKEEDGKVFIKGQGVKIGK